MTAPSPLSTLVAQQHLFIMISSLYFMYLNVYILTSKKCEMLFCLFSPPGR